jgi:creatinine amidohydrolase
LQLHHRTWIETEQYLADCRGILVPIGSTEQHGPNGLIGTDALCAEVISRGVGEATGALVAPTLSIGMAQHHMAFPGTVTFRPSTMIAVIRDVVTALAEHGFQRFLFVNGHGGNVATISAAFAEIWNEQRQTHGANAAALKLQQLNWWDNDGVRRLSRDLFGSADGAHATASEVAVTQWAFPDTIKSAEMSPKVAPTGPIRDAADYRRRFPDGRIGSDPSLATPEAGGRLYRAAVDAIAGRWQRFLAED